MQNIVKLACNNKYNIQTRKMKSAWYVGLKILHEFNYEKIHVDIKTTNINGAQQLPTTLDPHQLQSTVSSDTRKWPTTLNKN